MDPISMSALVLIVLSAVFAAIVCLSWKAMVKKEQRFIAEGKEIPEWITRRRRYIKYCHERFQNNRKLNFLLFLAVITVMIMMQSLLESGCLQMNVLERIIAGTILLMTVIVPFICCISVHRMRKEETRLIAEGKEIPDWIIKRKAFLKECNERFNHRKAPWVWKLMFIAILTLLIAVSMGLI
jgi:transcriptional regulator NrdR family protein